MKMVFVARTILGLAPAVKRLVGRGIPLALWKLPEGSYCLEVWLRDESDIARTWSLLGTGVLRGLTRRVPAGRRCARGRWRGEVVGSDASRLGLRTGSGLWGGRWPGSQGSRHE